MTQAEVRHVLGAPTWAGNGYCIGAGNKPVARWEYRRWDVGRLVFYYVDFDFIGPGGTPVVFRTERCSQEWLPLPWWRAKWSMNGASMKSFLTNPALCISGNHTGVLSRR